MGNRVCNVKRGYLRPSTSHISFRALDKREYLVIIRDNFC